MKRVFIALVLFVPLALGTGTPDVGAAHTGSRTYASFAGSWYYHGFNVDVTATGVVYAVYRTYTWCSRQQRYECDHIVGGQIIDGGLWAAYLQKRSGAAATGFIAASAIPSLSGTTIVLVRRVHDFLFMTWGAAGHRVQTTLCGSRVAPSTRKCGA
ncbi:MAG: hypothetical protein ACR2JC_11330 [Chloroflexota bacterium]|nr:MAG: hypothetical protein DLM70_01460 [Chloroflexota bacterium]